MLNALEAAVHRAVPVLAEQLPGFRDHVHDAVAEVDASISEAQRVLHDAEPQ